MAKKKKASAKKTIKKEVKEDLFTSIKKKIKFLENNPKYGLIGIVVFAFILGLFLLDFKLNLTGDNITFIELGKSVARGDGLGNSAKYPYIFPTLLAVVQLISGSGVVAQKLMVFILFIAAAPFLYLIFRKFTGVTWSLIIMTAVLSSPHLIEYSHYIMSEIPFLFVSVLALFFVIKSEDKDTIKDNKWFWLSIIGVAAAYYTRTAGLAIIAALILYHLIRKEWQKSGITILGTILLLAPWFIRNSRIPGGNEYSQALFSINPYQPELGRLTIGGFIDRIIINAKLYFTDFGGNVIPKIILPIHFDTSTEHGASFSLLVSVLLCAIAVGGVIYSLIKNRDILSVYIIVYMGMLLVYPQVWSGSRFVIPVIPLIIFFTYYILITFLKYSSRFKSNLLPTVILGMCILFLSGVHIRNDFRYNKFMSDYPPAWKNYFTAAEWVKNNSDKDAVIVCRKPELFGTAANREGSNFVRSENYIEIIKHFYEADLDYLIIANIGYGDIGRYLVPTYEKYKEHFQIVHVAGRPGTRTETYVMKILKDKPLPEK